MPRAGPGRGRARGEPLRHLRQRPALPPRMGRQEGRDRGPRVQRPHRGARRRRDRLGDRRSGRRRADGRGAGAASTASPTARSSASERDRVGTGESDWQGAFTRYTRVNVGDLLRIPDGLSMRHAALTEPLAVVVARHHPRRRRPARDAVAGHRRRADRLPVGRGATGDGRRRRRRERAAREAARVVRAARRANGGARRPADAGDAARHGRRTVRLRARVFGQPQRDGGRARAVEAGRHAGARRRGDAPAPTSTTTVSC